MSTDFDGLLGALSNGGVDFIIVGGLAATLHGSARATYDVDVVYSRSPDNIKRLVTTLAPLEPYLRGAPPGLPFQFNLETVRRGLNFTLATTLGDLDLLGEIVGGGDYGALLPHSAHVELFGHPCRCLTLEALIRAKRAAGRPRDLEALAELEALLEDRRKT